MRTRDDEVELESYLHNYVKELQLHRYSRGYQDGAQRVLTLFFSHLREKGVEDIRAVSEEHLLSFLRFLRECKTKYDRPFALWTQSAYVSAIRRFFAFLDKRSVILRNPAEHIRAPRAKRLPRTKLSRNQVQQLLETPSPTSTLGVRDRAILETFYGTGVRLSECVRLDVSDADLQGRTLWVRDGKGRKDRLVPIPGQTAKALERYASDARPYLVHDPMEQAFFLSQNGRRLSPPSIQAKLRDYGKAAGVPHRVHPHVLRHAYATHLLERGADIRHIQELLGHSFLQTTALYTQVEPKDLRKVMKKAHPRERTRRRRKKGKGKRR